MRKIRLGPSVTVFALFFLLALIEALQSQNWLAAALFASVAALSLWSDSRSRARRAKQL